MLRATYKSLLAHKLRLALSAIAVILGVAFVAGSLIFTDTLGKTFRDLFAQTAADVTVTRDAEFSSAFDTGSSTTVPDELVQTVAAVEGVDLVEPQVSVQGVQILGADGEVVGAQGAPGLGGDWSDTEGVSSLVLVEGRAPQGPDEVVVDSGAAEDGDLTVGGPVRLLMPAGEPVEPTLVGVARFGETGNLAGATLTMWDRETAQELLLTPGEWSALAVRAAEGVDEQELADRVDAVVGSQFSALSAQEQADENASDLEQGLSFINIFLLVFAGVALFVGSFIILNTFTMLVAQRTRELALLRAVGASRRQVTRSVLLEAAAVGFVGATLGIGLGFGLAMALRALFGIFGLDLGDEPLVFTPRTVAWSYLVGIVVTVVAAYFPARKAARVAPVAAMREDVGMAPRGLRRRGWVGAALAAAGVAALTAGLLSGGTTAASLVGVGVLLVLVGMAVLSPVLSRPIVGALAAGYPRLFGTVGRLGRDNALRNPRRTAATASALMIGLALVGAMGTVAASTNASLSQLVDDSLGADFVVSDAAQMPFTATIAASIRDVDGVASVNQQRFVPVQADGQGVFAIATDPATLDTALTLDYAAGGTAGLQGSGLLVDVPTAQARGWEVGDTVEVAFTTGRATLEVGGIFESNAALGPFVVSLDTLTAAGGDERDTFLYVDAAPDADVAAVRAGIDSELAAYPNVTLKDQTEFKEEQQGQVNQFLYLIYALLALSIGIAVLGIVNTLALSVIERTREIGLLRAVGMLRRQLRRMVVLEAVVISVFGALLGLGVGVGFGVALQQALSDQGISVLAVPVSSLLLFLVLSAVVGVLAALWPARRAARIDVLRAITTE
jgi:putative ABC transport system permease protein